MRLVGFAVMSLDGCLTRHQDPGTSFASPEDHRFFRAALHAFDSVLVGRKTYEASRASPLWSRPDARLRCVLTSTPEDYAEITRAGELEFHNTTVPEAVANLEARGRENCAVLGGARVFTDACSANLLDELWVTLEPLAFGQGERMFEGRVDFRFALSSAETLSKDTLLLKYRRLVA